jgi:hypothetical protein
MKRILCAAVFLAASAVAAHAGDPFAGYYGNTVNIAYPDGKTTAKAYVNADKTWENKTGDKTTKGTYEVKPDGTACFTQSDPAPAPDQKPLCLKIDEHKAGDSWSTKDDKGAETKYSMTAGR